MIMKPKHICLLFAAALVASCGDHATETSNTATAPPEPSAALQAVIDAPVTGDPQPIHLVRESAKPGDSITVSGRVMGNLHPFVEGRAAFILGDPAVLTACSDRPGDECETPWDTCCDTAADKKRGTATIQIVGTDGRVLKEGIEGVGGIGKLSTLAVTGTVADGSSAESLVIDASAIDVRQ